MESSPLGKFGQHSHDSFSLSLTPSPSHPQSLTLGFCLTALRRHTRSQPFQHPRRRHRVAVCRICRLAGLLVTARGRQRCRRWLTAEVAPFARRASRCMALPGVAAAAECSGSSARRIACLAVLDGRVAWGRPVAVAASPLLEDQRIRTLVTSPSRRRAHCDRHRSQPAERELRRAPPLCDIRPSALSCRLLEKCPLGRDSVRCFSRSSVQRRGTAQHESETETRGNWRSAAAAHGSLQLTMGTSRSEATENHEQSDHCAKCGELTRTLWMTT